MGIASRLARFAIGGSLLLAILLSPASASAAECTHTWTGAVSGEWQTIGNWSPEEVPGPSDVACIPKEKTAQVVEGAHSVETVQGEGGLTILAGSLAIIGEEQSHIKKLHLSGGALRGPAELLITEFLNADGGSMEGAGKTVLGAEATGLVAAPEEGEGPGLRLTEIRELEVKGALDIAGLGGQLNAIEGSSAGIVNTGKLAINGPEGGVALTDSADLVNGNELTVGGPEGNLVLNDNAELFNNDVLQLKSPEGGIVSREKSALVNSGDLTIEGSAGEIRSEGTSIDNLGTLAIEAAEGRIRGSEGAEVENIGTLIVNGEGEGNGLVAGAGAQPKLENFGTVLKDEGAERANVEFKIDNESLVKAETGVLAFSGGGNSGQSFKDTWVAIASEEAEEEPAIVFTDELFTLGEVAGLTGLICLEGSATVKSHRLEADESEVWAIDGDLELTGVGKESEVGGLIVSIGGVSLAKEGILKSEEAFLEGGNLDVGADASASIDYLSQGVATTSLGSGAHLDAKGVFLEAGTFETGAEAEVLIGSFLQKEGTASVGDGSTVDIEATAIEDGSVVVGTGSTGSLGAFFQERGSFSVGASSMINFGPVTVLESSLSLGSGTESELGSVYVETGTLTLGTEATVTMPAFFQEEGLFELGEGAFATIEVGGFEGGTLTGDGSLAVDVFWWGQTVMDGDGSITVNQAGAIGSGEGFASLDERRLITHGFFSLGESTLMMGDGARLKNEAEFNASSEATGYGAQIRVAEGSVTNPRIINEHEFSKTSGTGTTEVTVPFENNGSINQFSGTLHIVNRLGVPASEKFGFRCYCGDPVETASGDLSESQTDIAVGGRGVGLYLTRSYSAQAAAAAVSPGIFGYGWYSSFNDYLTFGEEGKRITVVRADGSTVPFVADGEGGFAPPDWSQDTLAGNTEAGYTYVKAGQIARHFAPSGALQAVIDRNGNETMLAYTETGKLKTITDPAERQITLAYNGEGLVESTEDPMGHSVQYGYEGKELTSVTLPGEEEPRWRFEYDGSHRMTKLIDGRGGETINEYDAASRVISQTDPANRTLNFEYDGFHTRFENEGTGAVTDLWFNSNNQPTSITRGYGTEDASTERFSYDHAGHQLTKADGNGHTTTFTYNPAGDRTSMTDAAEHETKWEYNAAHDVISETTPNGETTTIVRDAAGNPETISRPAPGETVQTMSFEYDAAGLLEGRTDPLERTWTYEYNGQGDRKAETNPEGEVRTWAYDENSQLTSTVSPRGNEEGAEPSEFTTTIERDAQGRPEKVIDPLGHDTEYAYDANGNLESETNAKGNATEFAYNPADQLIEIKKPNGAILKTEYDDAGEVIAQIDGNEEAMTYVRNVLGQPIEIIDPLERKTTQTFDATGNLEAVVDPAERVTTYSYDPADRLESINYSDEGTPDASFEYDPNGNLVRMVDGSGESIYDYDELARLEEATNGHGDTVAYKYNLANEQEKIVYPNGKAVDQTFDNAGRLESVTDWLGNTTALLYDADSNLEAIEFPEATGNVDEFSHDPTARMTAVTVMKDPETLASIGYERDKLGQVEALASQGLPGPEEEAYEYDKNNRLIKAGSETFEYDLADNPTKMLGSTNVFDKASQLESGTEINYEYNVVGERVKSSPSTGPATSYSYDQAGNLASVKRAAEGEVPGISEAFAYDGSDLLVAHTIGESTGYLTWDPTRSLPVLLADGRFSYVYGPQDLPIEQISTEEEPTYLHRDQIGSTRLLTDNSGKPSATFTYGAYGTLKERTGAADTRMGFAGQYTFDQSGLQYLRARAYDPRTGQFLTRDPIEDLTREPYSYGRSNPVNNTDPSGHETSEVEVPCVWPACPPPPPAVETVEEAVNSVEDFLNSLFPSASESEVEGPRLTRAEREYEEEHHECPVERTDWRQDKKVTEQELKEAGLSPHDLKQLGSGSDIYKDREGNLYEKPHGGRGPGDPLGINIKDLL